MSRLVTDIARMSRKGRSLSEVAWFAATDVPCPKCGATVDLQCARPVPYSGYMHHARRLAVMKEIEAGRLCHCAKCGLGHAATATHTCFSRRFP
jgi:hypothetical protein